jgi:septal ring factor EnvC (AmiA/AmiB activator)
MSNWQLVLTTISVFVGIAGFTTAFIVALTNNKRANKAEQRQSNADLQAYTEKQTEQTILLGQIGKDVSDIKRDMSKIDEKIERLGKDTFKNSNDITTLWKRFDELKEFTGFGKAATYGK